MKAALLAVLISGIGMGISFAAETNSSPSPSAPATNSTGRIDFPKTGNARTDKVFDELGKAIEKLKQGAPQLHDPLTERANLHFRVGEFPEAIAKYRDALKGDPSSDYARFLLACALVQTDDLSNAHKELETLNQRTPNLSAARFLQRAVKRQLDEPDPTRRWSALETEVKASHDELDGHWFWDDPISDMRVNEFRHGTAVENPDVALVDGLLAEAVDEQEAERILVGMVALLPIDARAKALEVLVDQIKPGPLYWSARAAGAMRYSSSLKDAAPVLAEWRRLDPDNGWPEALALSARLPTTKEKRFSPLSPRELADVIEALDRPKFDGRGREAAEAAKDLARALRSPWPPPGAVYSTTIHLMSLSMRLAQTAQFARFQSDWSTADLAARASQRLGLASVEESLRSGITFDASIALTTFNLGAMEVLRTATARTGAPYSPEAFRQKSKERNKRLLNDMGADWMLPCQLPIPKWRAEIASKFDGDPLVIAALRDELRAEMSAPGDSISSPTTPAPNPAAK